MAEGDMDNGVPIGDIILFGSRKEAEKRVLF
jgi:hypothetical protein